MFLNGSCRDFAAAFNREPDIFRQKVKAIYVNAGIVVETGVAPQIDFNVELDPIAFFQSVRIWRADLLVQYPAQDVQSELLAGRIRPTSGFMSNASSAPVRLRCRTILSIASRSLRKTTSSFLTAVSRKSPQLVRSRETGDASSGVPRRSVMLLAETSIEKALRIFTHCSPKKPNG